MKQKNKNTSKEREIRAPFKWKPPAKPLMDKGSTFVITVKPGMPGTTVTVPNPKDKSQMIAVNVPAAAKVGQAMVVPIPTGAVASLAEVKGSEYKPPEHKDEKEKKKWSTGAKVAAATAGVAVVGGAAVGGAILGEHIAEEGWDATMADLGDVAADAGDAIETGAEAAIDWTGDAAE